ncbi:MULTISPECIES: protein-glutamate O-methyltransferase CheR [Acidobacterium]|uniref:protein-glutamate O-methyltransferase n=1 Tax=Acidobacterium capsulatum (strain ATCC 51196 / DSM 11244 / BCRC 80197 / JCM 7670 / NBRC 15755 / NCIMB 13165 / 161) TaxID=240015 RepID=C1F3H3_ACIC5|nr:MULTISPECIES: protein-glutamate O-methyltransferase CheR [Acidobacterium]ACO32209.1 chemotaxis protein methyltransferase CheR [Acidobacterium capsulatum ATCC 51196]HCT60199.1 protein-glutamate O-methyltransferase CheR [Acidobacterium sp.]
MSLGESSSVSSSAGVAPPIQLTAKEFATICSLAKEEFGLELGQGKEQLVAARLGKVARRHGFRDFPTYYKYLKADQSGQALVELIDALTTNHTSFFREPAHFDFMVREILPAAKRSGALSIWSAACSTGEEPYSIALTAREQGETPQIMATDISTRALDTARRAVYSAERFEQPLPAWLRKHLLKGEGQWQGHYRIGPQVQAMVSFRRLNLIEPLPSLGPFQLIFCRNVMIYFSRETQEHVVRQLEERLEPGGYLFVGHSESLTGIQHNLQQLQPAIYRKRGGSR